MKKTIISFIFWLTKKILSLRYKIDIKGLEQISSKHLDKKGGVLILPNHPAHLDPIFLFLFLWPKLHMRPLAIEYMYRKPFLHFFMKLFNTLPIPDFSESINEIKLEKGKKVVTEIKRGLKLGQSFLLYPSGRLKLGSKEIIGGASATHEIIQECPEVNIVLVRTTGLWGSMFSRAQTGNSPEFLQCAKKGIFTVIKNGLFFTPRRKVSIEISVNPSDFPWKASRLEMNRYLENWYNQYLSYEKKLEKVELEPLVLVSYSFYRKDYPDIHKVKEIQKKKVGQKISPKKQHEIYQYLSSLSDVSEKNIKPSMSLAMDLGLDSLDIANLITFLTDKYEVHSLRAQDIENVEDVLYVAQSTKGNAKEQEDNPPYFHWPEEKRRPVADMNSETTIYASFLEKAKQMKNYAAIADDISGVLSYGKLTKAILILSLEIAKIPGKYQAIMLPASCGGYIAILATLFANKTPVMLNWTLGPRYLDEMLKITHTKKVISSWKFLEKLSNVEFGKAKDSLVLLEDIKRNLSLRTKIKGLVLSLKSTKAILRKLKLNKNTPEDIATVLFTSGTEALPKAVPLSHKNILLNQQAAIKSVSLEKNDVLFGVLPPFHSFGFSVTGLFPILAGLRVAFYPNPTDSFALANGIKKWKVTIFCGAPSFIQGLLSVAKKEDLQTLRLFVTGAEKAPDSLFRKISHIKKDMIVIEGYGITECAPIISLTSEKGKRIGVGELVQGIEACTIHPETHELLAPGEVGEICISGPNVFSGYLGKRTSPFITIKEKNWYRTGDLGRIDAKRNIILSGRLKRFAKIGGEMISLAALEEVICAHFVSEPEEEEGAKIAICVKESQDEKPTLTLITTFPIDKAQVNELLQKEGFSRLIKIYAVVKISSIPLLGTGKVDYRTLQTYV